MLKVSVSPRDLRKIKDVQTDSELPDLDHCEDSQPSLKDGKINMLRIPFRSARATLP